MPGLDKFYTQTHVSKQCFEFLHQQLNITDDVIYLLSQRRSVIGNGLKWFEISFQNTIEDSSPIYSIFN